MQLSSFVLLLVIGLMGIFLTGARAQIAADSACLQPMEVGICRASLPRFYYSAATGDCTGFMYGGCVGNGNNFPTLEDCRKACKK